MAFNGPPRSAADATRFTSTTPHAAAASTSASSSSASSRFQPPSSASSRFQPPSLASSRASQRAGAAPPRQAGGGGGVGGGGGPAGETPEQKVARLRAAHLAAKNAQVSWLDRVVAGARHAFDSAHRITIFGLVGFTAIAGLLTVYTTVDMLRFNRRRKLEFQEAQRNMEADSLAAARLAFMRNEATPEQIAMVEAARAREQAAAAAAAPATGQSAAETGSVFKVPSLLGAPAPVASASTTSAPTTTTTNTNTSGWFAKTLARQEEGDVPGSSQSRLGYESLCEEDDAPGLRESDLVRAVEDRARQALAREREAQRRGGPLDRLGLDNNSGQAATAATAAAAPPASGGAKKSWWQVW